MDLSIIILNWNAGDDTIACIHPILQWQQIRPLTIVIDNASTDGSADKIAAALPDVQLIRNGRNEGFAGGSNRGMEAALVAGDAPVLLLNNDATIAEVDVLRLLQTLDEQPEIGFVVPQIFNAESNDLISSGGKNPVLHHQTRVRSFPNDAPVQIVETVSGTAVLLRPTMLRQIGLLDERFFFSTELADLCLRGKKHGFLSAVEQRARATHTVSRSVDYRSSLYVYYIVRNRFLILRNHYRRHLPLYLFWAAYSAALSFKLRLTGPQATARAVRLGLWDGVNGRFGGQNERVLAYCNR
ncbi:MAG: glycosyltransferase family 2 protein [Anaerolineales bacterium]|nr:glycosyltransferase family 2 protein [Anaerolineales bacterium]